MYIVKVFYLFIFYFILDFIHLFVRMRYWDIKTLTRLTQTLRAFGTYSYTQYSAYIVD